MLSLTDLGQNAGTRALLLKSAKSAVERLIVLHTYFCHFYTSLLYALKQEIWYHWRNRALVTKHIIQ
ncbi:hypothetical protein EDD78_102299 [Harryflintia acetispora]|uniref:Uncharacterized protein n=1 Tax=Harryflintia acetispora TaxID=1849041 RepID=A0A9X8ULH3_9FIRM|nr:hypothetical protein EDD78_102299 [Harryflintia acetispora]